MSVNFLFDIDGTLTPSRQPIDLEFKKFFSSWLQNHNVYLVSGSDYPKSLEQVGPEILHNAKMCFNSAGNVVYKQGQEIHKNNWTPSPALITLLEHLLKESPYPERYGNHIEQRTGMVNFSIIGRNCPLDKRLAYFAYDNRVYERKRLCEIIMTQFPALDVTIGGQISIDIYEKGHDKAQVLSWLQGPIYFFGDRTEEGGNDYTIAKELTKPPHKVFQVNNWQETYKILQKF